MENDLHSILFPSVVLVCNEIGWLFIQRARGPLSFLPCLFLCHKICGTGPLHSPPTHGIKSISRDFVEFVSHLGIFLLVSPIHLLLIHMAVCIWTIFWSSCDCQSVLLLIRLLLRTLFGVAYHARPPGILDYANTICIDFINYIRSILTTFIIKI